VNDVSVPLLDLQLANLTLASEVWDGLKLFASFSKSCILAKNLNFWLDWWKLFLSRKFESRAIGGRLTRLIFLSFTIFYVERNLFLYFFH